MLTQHCLWVGHREALEHHLGVGRHSLRSPGNCWGAGLWIPGATQRPGTAGSYCWALQTLQDLRMVCGPSCISTLELKGKRRVLQLVPARSLWLPQ